MAEQDTELTPEQQAEQQQARQRKRLLLLGGGIGLLVVLSIVVTLILLRFVITPELEDGVEPPPQPAAQAAIYYPLNPSFVANYEVRGRQRFLQLEMALMLRDNTLISGIELHMPAIRNSLIMLLAGQIYEELQTPEGKELLRQQAHFAVQEVLERELGRSGIEQVLFTSFVMQ